VNDKIHVAVVGSSIGQSHVTGYKSLPDRFEVIALCDNNEVKGCEMVDRYQIPHFYNNLDDLCLADDIDVIDICTPPHLHYQMAQQVLAAGKHAVIEKPIAASLAEVDQLIAAETLSGKRLMPIFQYRFGHGVQKLKWLVDQEITGIPYLTTIETAWRRRPEYYAIPWRGKWETELGGPILTLAIHAHDILYYILGKAKRVFALTTTRVNPIQTEDCISASLEMVDGSLCTISVTTGSAKEISRHRFCFSALVAESNLEPYTNTADPWQFVGDSPEINQKIEAVLADFSPLPEGFAGQFYRLSEALRNGSELPVTLTDARNALELVTAVYTSAQSGQAVTLPIGSDHPNYNGWRPS